MLNLANYQYAGSVGPAIDKPMYTYITAANGLFIKAERTGLSVQLPLRLFDQPVRGLETLTPYVRLQKPVPSKWLYQIVSHSRKAMPNEALFYLTHSWQASWRLIIPEQTQSRCMVQPQDVYASQDMILIEIHSHNSMSCFFSQMDDKEETGFRIYGVLGCLDTKLPQLKMRVGVYGHFLPISYRSVFEVSRGCG